MKQFSFKFDKILDYRDHLEKKTLTDLMVARKEYMDKKNKVRRLVTEKSENIAQCRTKAVQGMNADLYKVYQVFTTKLNSDLEDALIELQNKEERVSEYEKKLQQASIKKKSLEVLKDFKLKNYAKNLAKEEQKIMDEIAVMQHRVNR